jgi:hypothetical protein
MQNALFQMESTGRFLLHHYFKNDATLLYEKGIIRLLFPYTSGRSMPRIEHNPVV